MHQLNDLMGKKSHKSSFFLNPYPGGRVKLNDNVPSCLVFKRAVILMKKTGKRLLRTFVNQVIKVHEKTIPKYSDVLISQW